MTWDGARRFTAEEDQTILRLHAEGVTQAEIGRQIGRDPTSVKSALNRLGKIIPRGRETSAARDRSCLGCRRTFRSQGNHNRLCGSCRDRDLSPYAPA